MKKFVILFILLYNGFSFCQVNKDSSMNVKPTIIWNNGIQDLISLDKEIKKSIGGINGYSVVIYVGNKREDAQGEKYKFMKFFPEIKNVSYERISPNWKVRIGRYRTKLEAQRIQNLIIKKFPNSFIIEIIVPVGGFN